MYNATKHLRETTNIYQLFTTEKVERLSPDHEDYVSSFLTVQEFHQSFSNWYKLEFKGNKAPTRTTFSEEIEALLSIKAEGNKFYGIRWKSNMNEIAGLEFAV